MTAVARRAEQTRQKAKHSSDWLPVPPPPITPAPPRPKTSNPNVTVYPDLALAMLREEQTAVGRVWLLMRHVDEDGRGWLSIEEVREKLARNGSPFRICGWRQMRNLLARGDGIFWRRDKRRVWLFGVTKTAVALNISHLQQRPVAVPAAALAKSIGEARAHLYAAFHSSRMKESGDAAPIARATLNELSGLSGHTQRKYERQTGVRAQSNYSIGAKIGETAVLTTAVLPTGAEEQVWQNGRAAFTFNDKKGKQGAAGSKYIAWQLPNSYAGPHAHQKRGQQKRINRQLADLFMKGMMGNGKQTIDTYRPRRFFANGTAANNAKRTDNTYWQSHHNGIWYKR